MCQPKGHLHMPLSRPARPNHDFFENQGKIAMQCIMFSLTKFLLNTENACITKDKTACCNLASDSVEKFSENFHRFAVDCCVLKDRRNGCPYTRYG